MDMPKTAGWFDDPSDPSQLRYFDGVIWTKHTAPRTTRAASGVPQPGQQAFPGQGHAPQYPGQAAAQPPQVTQQPAQQAHPQFPGTPQHPQWTSPQQGWNAPGYGGFTTGPTTPDGQRLASYGQRVGAYIIDAIITGILSAIVAGWALYRAMAPFLDQVTSAVENNDPTALQGLATDFDFTYLLIFSMLSAAVYFAYHVFFLSRTGATPGKAVLGISVRLRERPGVITPAQAARRTVLQAGLAIVGNIPLIGTLASVGSVVDLLWPAWDDKKQALHDKIAATNVVVGKQERRAKA